MFIIRTDYSIRLRYSHESIKDIVINVHMEKKDLILYSKDAFDRLNILHGILSRFENEK